MFPSNSGSWRIGSDSVGFANQCVRRRTEHRCNCWNSGRSCGCCCDCSADCALPGGSFSKGGHEESVQAQRQARRCCNVNEKSFVSFVLFLQFQDSFYKHVVQQARAQLLFCSFKRGQIDNISLDTLVIQQKKNHTNFSSYDCFCSLVGSLFVRSRCSIQNSRQ